MEEAMSTELPVEVSSLALRMSGQAASQGFQAASKSWKRRETLFWSFQKDQVLGTLCPSP